MMMAAAGVIPAECLAAQVGVVAGGALVGEWLARLDDWREAEGEEDPAGQDADGDEEGEASEEAASERRARQARSKEREELARLVQLAEEKLPDFELARYHLGDRRRRNYFPDWVADLGGFRRLFAVVLVLVVANLGVALAARPPNYFEMLGVKPTMLEHHTIGLLLMRALKQGIDPRFGLGPEEVKTVGKIMRSADLRFFYDVHGTPDASLRTLSDIAMALRGTMLFYGGWLVFLLALCSVSRRLRDAFTPGVIVLGVCLFLDASVSLDLSSLRDNLLLNALPVFEWLTTFERLLFLRHFAVPPLVLACLLYSSHTFVDYEEHSLEYILGLWLRTERAGVSMDRCIELCQQRREIIAKARAGSAGKAKEAASPAARLRQRAARGGGSRATAPPAGAADAAPAGSEPAKGKAAQRGKKKGR